MEAGKTIRLVATFVVGVVLVTGAALIYLVAKEPREEHAPIRQWLPGPSRLPTPPAHVGSSEIENAAGPPASSPISMQASEFEAYSPAASATSPSAGSRNRHTAGYHSGSTPTQISSNSALPTRIASSGVPAGLEPPTTDPPNVVRHQAGTEDDKALALAAQPHRVTLPAGTPLTVKLTKGLSTDQTKQGQFFQAILASPIIRDGFVLAETGSAVTGEVVRAKRAGLFGRAPELRLTLLDIHASDNQVARIQTTLWDYTGRSHNVVTGTFRSAMGAVTGAVQGAARGSGITSQQKNAAVNGRTILVPANTVLEFRLLAPVSLTERFHQ